jgi:hypothetical protein
MSTNNPATDILPYFIYQNLGKLSGNTVSASSEDTQYPVEHIIDPLRSKTWRSKLGWNIVVGFNDRLDFTEGVTGDASAAITPGNYATGDLLAAEIQTQLNAAATDNTYAVTYSVSTFKFTIARDTGAATIGLEWSTGTNTTRSIGADLGYDVSADDTGGTSYTADNTAYKSREWILFQMTAALDVKEAIVLDYNWDSASGDTVTIEGNATNAWTAPSFTDVLDQEHADGNLTMVFFSATQTYQYWRILVEDQFYNTAGFTEIGLAFYGGHLQLTRDFAFNYVEGRNELSKPQNADQGAPWLNVKRSPKTWDLSWKAINETDKNNLHTMQDAVKLNKGFFFAFAPSTGPEKTEYVKLNNPLSFSGVSHNLYSTQVKIEQALG